MLNLSLLLQLWLYIPLYPFTLTTSLWKKVASATLPRVLHVSLEDGPSPLWGMANNWMHLLLSISICPSRTQFIGDNMLQKLFWIFVVMLLFQLYQLWNNIV